jgi:hypothetical protein
MSLGNLIHVGSGSYLASGRSPLFVPRSRDTAAEPIVRELVERAVGRLRHLCAQKLSAIHAAGIRSRGLAGWSRRPCPFRPADLPQCPATRWKANSAAAA